MADRPNVLLLVSDTMGLNAVSGVGGTGYGPADTPAIDELAAEGIALENAYAAAPVCGPSRAGLLTGRYPHDVGGWTNGLPLYAGVRELGEYFRAAGYRTGHVGKYHIDGDYWGDGVAPDHYESEYWYDGQNYRDEIGEDFFEWWWEGGLLENDNAEHDPTEVRERGITRVDTWAGNVTDRAVDFLESAGSDDRPYFLVVSYDEPHEPSLCPPEFAERHVDDLPDFPENYETLAELADKPSHQQEEAQRYAEGDRFIDSLSSPERGVLSRPAYVGCTEFVDDEIGRVLEAADAANTVTTFTSDHGHHLGAHGLDSKWATAYDEVVNVPFVVRYPDRIPAGETRSGIASHLDVVPTLLDFAGIDADEPLHGRSMRGLLESGTRHREHALVEYHGFSRGRVGGDGLFPIRAAVTEDAKLVVNLPGEDEFYDREADPGEVENRIDDPAVADRRDELHDAILEIMDETADPFNADGWIERDWR
jgi:uncharacterized sulfatase